MPLTEEQRAAITTAIDGIDECFARSAEWMTAEPVLRAMIDSSEHFTDASKMIGFDLEKARAVDIDLLAATDWGELRRHYCAALAEIERLRAIIDTPSEEPEWVVDFKKLNRFAGVGYSLIDIEIAKKWHAAYRKAQNSNLLRKQENERMRADLADSENRNEDLRKGIDDLSTTIFSGAQTAQIKKLEDALKEERAKYNVAGHGECSYRTPIRNDPLLWKCDKVIVCDWNCCPIKDEKLVEALQELQAEGKIGNGHHIVGPDQMVPNGEVWQITEERIEALRSVGKIEAQILPRKVGNVLRAMLTEADHDKP